MFRGIPTENGHQGGACGAGASRQVHAEARYELLRFCEEQYVRD